MRPGSKWDSGSCRGKGRRDGRRRAAAPNQAVSMVSGRYRCNNDWRRRIHWGADILRLGSHEDRRRCPLTPTTVASGGGPGRRFQEPFNIVEIPVPLAQTGGNQTAAVWAPELWPMPCVLTFSCNPQAIAA